ncbi:MAG: S8 family peptidase [Tepidibacillus sp.]
MNRILSLLSIMVFILALTTSTFANEAKLNSPKPLKTYFIGFNNKVDLNLIQSYGSQVKREYKYMPMVAVKLPDQAMQALMNNPAISYVEEDGEVQAIGQLVPWGIPHVKATDVQQTGVKGLSIKVGIIDTGIDDTHEDLKVSGGVTFVQGTNDYMDDNGHGTHLAGTIAALDNSLGIIGVAPQASLYAIKVLDQYGSGSYSDVVAGIEWAITNHMDIVNMSLGGSNSSRTLQTAVDNACNAGILLVAAAGNNGYDKKGTITYPAKYDSVIAVGAVDQQNNRASFSSVGRELELMAPGVSIQSTMPGGYSTYNGTSMAAPHVTGVAALVLETYPELDNVQIRNTLNESVAVLGDSFSYGNGLVNAWEAVNSSGSNSGNKGKGKK